MKKFSIAMIASGVVSFVSLPLAAHADSVTLGSMKDNTLIETSGPARSNGKGDGIYAGQVGFMGGATNRRAVLAFDVSRIPAGSTITDVSLTLRMVMTQSDSEMISVHRLLADWGEGTSESDGGSGELATPGDATWMHTFFDDQFWTTEGGDFNADESAALGVDAAGSYTWPSTAEMIADVQQWVDDPGSNFGWLLLGDESEDQTVKKFASREWDVAGQRPRLVVTFDPPAKECPEDLDGSGEVGFADLLAVLTAWGPCPGCPEDIDGDDTVGFTDLISVLTAWGPCP